MTEARRAIFSNLDGREQELKALVSRFNVTSVPSSRRSDGFLFISDKLDFFFAQLRQAGFEFEEFMPNGTPKEG